MEGGIDKFKKEKSKTEFLKDTNSNVWSKFFLFWNSINNIRNLFKVDKMLGYLVCMHIIRNIN